MIQPITRWRINSGISIDYFAIVVIVSFLLIAILTTFAINTEIFVDILSGPESTNHGRNFLEILYFMSNIILVLVALWALRFAQSQSVSANRQVEEQLRMNRAEIYLRISETITSLSMRNSITLCREIQKAHPTIKSATIYGPPIPIGFYTTTILDDWKNNDAAKFTSIVDLFNFLEHLGLLVGREYILLDDVYYLFEGPLKEFGEVFTEYLIVHQASSIGGRMYEHAVNLLKVIPAYTTKVKITIYDREHEVQGLA